MKPNIKKLLILNAPYLLFVYLFDKVGQAVRLSPGADLSGKLLSIGSGFSAAFSNALPSFAPMDLLIGIVGAVVIRLAVYVKGKMLRAAAHHQPFGLRQQHVIFKYGVDIWLYILGIAPTCPAEFCPYGFAYRHCRGCRYPACGLCERQERKEIP